MIIEALNDLFSTGLSSSVEESQKKRLLKKEKAEKERKEDL